MITKEQRAEAIAVLIALEADDAYATPVRKAAKIALFDMEAQQAATDPQPLTKEQLKERIEKPIFIIWYWESEKKWVKQGWIIIDKGDMDSAFIDGWNKHKYGKTWLAYDHEPGAQAVVDSAETADVAPVKRGEWKDSYVSGYTPADGIVCGACDCWAPRRSKYCPSCGRRLEGQNDTDNNA
jgi:hypothetical protein